MIDAIDRFANDLRTAGAGPDETVAVTALYERALNERSRDAWSSFYRATFWVVRALAGAPDERGPGGRAAVASLHLLLEDDLGRTLFAGLLWKTNQPSVQMP